MDDLLKAIEEGRGVLTEEERAALEEYADSTGEPKSVWQVYDNSKITDGDFLDTEEVGPHHPSEEEAVDWAKQRMEDDPEFTRWTVYRKIRCVTRARKIWYRQANSYVYDHS